MLYRYNINLLSRVYTIDNNLGGMDFLPPGISNSVLGQSNLGTPMKSRCQKTYTKRRFICKRRQMSFKHQVDVWLVCPSYHYRPLVDYGEAEKAIIPEAKILVHCGFCWSFVVRPFVEEYIYRICICGACLQLHWALIGSQLSESQPHPPVASKHKPDFL